MITTISQEFLIRSYKATWLDFRCASSEEEQWTARKQMAKLEMLAIEQYGEDFCQKIRNEILPQESIYH